LGVIHRKRGNLRIFSTLEVEGLKVNTTLSDYSLVAVGA
jgi:hypothetical protein